MFLFLLSLMKHISNLKLIIKRYKKYEGNNNKCKVQIYLFKKKSNSISQAYQLLKEICTLKSPFFFQLFNSSLDMGTCSNQSEWGRHFYDASAVQQATSSQLNFATFTDMQKDSIYG